MRPRRVVLIVVALLAPGAVALLAWRSPPGVGSELSPELHRPIMSSTEYAAVRDSHARPYVFTINSPPGAMCVVGAEHSKDPESPSVEAVKNAIDEFRPTVVLLEGRLGFHLGGMNAGIKKFGESAAAYSMGTQRGAAVYTWEMDRTVEVRRTLDRFPKERVSLYFVLRPYFSEARHGRPADPDQALESIRATRTRWPGLEGTLPSIAAIDEIWRRDFAGLPDWRDTSDAHGWPGPLEEIALDNRDLRTEHLARCLLGFSGQGERVLAVCGSSHAVRIRPALEP